MVGHLQSTDNADSILDAGFHSLHQHAFALATVLVSWSWLLVEAAV
jgi:hypothetical protein